MSVNGSTEGLVKWQYPVAEQEPGNQNVWKQMAYVPPRGPCGYKASIMATACTCLRFMVHPIKAPTSFHCDGCSHHACYHEMQNRIDEAITSRWTREDGSFDRSAYEADEEVQEVLAKRKRLGFPGEPSSSGNLLMPDKAKSTLVGQPNRKRIRTEKAAP